MDYTVSRRPVIVKVQGSIPGEPMWDLWCTSGLWILVAKSILVLLVALSCHHCSSHRCHVILAIDIILKSTGTLNHLKLRPTVCAY